MMLYYVMLHYIIFYPIIYIYIYICEAKTFFCRAEDDGFEGEAPERIRRLKLFLLYQEGTTWVRFASVPIRFVSVPIRFVSVPIRFGSDSSGFDSFRFRTFRKSMVSVRFGSENEYPGSTRSGEAPERISETERIYMRNLRGWLETRLAQNISNYI